MVRDDLRVDMKLADDVWLVLILDAAGAVLRSERWECADDARERFTGLLERFGGAA